MLPCYLSQIHNGIALTLICMAYSTRMRTLDRWSLSVVLRKSSILKNVVPFGQYKTTANK